MKSSNKMKNFVQEVPWYLYVLSILVSVCIVYLSANSIQSIESPFHRFRRSADNDDLAADSATSILDFLDVQSKKLEVRKQEDIVLFLGNTGGGKSTLVLLLTDAELESIEIVAGGGAFRIEHKSDRISKHSTTTSKTSVPELMLDSRNGAKYYDCPGFDDTRGVKNDISVTYLIRYLLQSASRVKFPFVISYSSVRIAGDRNNFKKLARHANGLIKDIEKYRDGIALMVSKVDNLYPKGKFVNDAKMIENIVKFLNETKREIEAENLQNISTKQKLNNKQIIKFIEILLEKPIGIFRVPEDEGPLKDMPLMQEEKNNILSIVSDHLQYVAKGDDDFDYSISEASKNRVTELIEETQKNLMSSVTNIGSKIKKFYSKQEEQASDLESLHKTLSASYQTLTQLNFTDLKSYEEQVIGAVNDLGITISEDISNSFSKQIDYIEFLKTVGNSSLSASFNIADGLSHGTQYLSESKTWYGFLINLRNVLSNQVPNSRDSFDYNSVELMEHCSAETNEEQSVDKIGLNEFLNRIGHKNLFGQGNYNLNKFKLNALKTVLDYVESKMWERFLNELHDRLSEYNVQKNIAQYENEVNEIVEKCSLMTNQEAFFKDIGLTQFLDRIEKKIYFTVKNFKINSSKAMRLNSVLHQTMNHIDTSCSSDKFVVRGYNVKVSDFINVTCKVKFMEVFALNKVIFDANINKTGEKVQLSIMAPTWDIVERTRIDLSGAPGQGHPNITDDENTKYHMGRRSAKGKSGLAGNPGNAAGHLFGIGKHFINEKLLEISVNGGKGGAGQDGAPGNLNLIIFCRF